MCFCVLLSVPCMKGSFYDTTTDKCQVCPIGTYQDEFGQLNCKQCPSLYSTLFSGQRNVTGCIRKNCKN